jgi:hypothetical protein
MNGDKNRKKIETIAITAMIAIAAFAGVMLAVGQQATPSDTDAVNNVVPGQIAYESTLLGKALAEK